MGAVIFLLIGRPPLSRTRWTDVPVLLGPGATGLLTVGFLSALEHVPPGRAVAIEFLGPLTVAALIRDARGAGTRPGSPAGAGRPRPSPLQVLGILLVVLAGAAARRRGHRPAPVGTAARS